MELRAHVQGMVRLVFVCYKEPEYRGHNWPPSRLKNGVIRESNGYERVWEK